MRHLRTMGLLALSTLVLAGCGQPPDAGVRVRGKTSDELGAQKQGLGGEALGGSGSVSAVTKVQISKLTAEGRLEAVGAAEVKNGSYEVTASVIGEKKLVVQALDAAGAVRESVIIESSGEEQTVTAPPMDTETSVEAEVLAQLVASGVTHAEANSIDLRARINAKTAEAVKASTDAAARIKALAEATAAAQRAQLKAYAEAGVTVTQAELFNAQLAAAAKLNGALDAAAAKADAEKAYDAFVTEVQAAAREKAGDAKKAARGERAASIAFRATVKARIGANGSALDPVADASVRQAAALEARTTAQAVEAALTAGTAAQAQLDAAKNAGATLRAAVASSTSVRAAAQAYTAYHASIVGSTGVTGSIVGNYLEVNPATATSVQPSINASATAATQLDAALTSAVTTSVQAANTINFDTFAASIVSALKTFDAAVQANATNLTGFGSKADVALELMTQANGSLRIAE